MKHTLQETRIHGTPMHPLKIYEMQDISGIIDVPAHWHENVEILLIQRGRLFLKINNISYTGGQGEIFYVNPHELHGMQSLTADCSYLAFLFPFSWLAFEQADEAQERYLKPLANRKAHVTTYLPQQTTADMRPILQHIFTLYKSVFEGSWLGLKACLLYFYSCIYKDGLVSRRQEESAQTDTLLKISRYVHEHYAEPLSLQLLGKEFHMSSKYFSVYFQKHFDRNFSDYLMAVRVEKAKKILLETDANMDLVAQLAGFSSSSYFIRVFRGSTELTPGQYRIAVRQLKTDSFK